MAFAQVGTAYSVLHGRLENQTVVKHTQSHVKRNELSLLTIRKDWKRSLTVFTAKACKLNKFPLCFSYRRPSFTMIARLLPELGQEFLITATIDLSSVFQSVCTTCARIERPASEQRETLTKQEIFKVVHVGNGIAYDVAVIEKHDADTMILSFLSSRSRKLASSAAGT